MNAEKSLHQVAITQKTPFLFRMLSGVAIISMMLSCSLFQPGGSSSDGTIKVGDAEIKADPTSGDLQQSEEEIIDYLRKPLREELGGNSDAIFNKLDNATNELLREIQQELDIQSHRPPGHAQFGGIYGVGITLWTIQEELFKKGEGSYDRQKKESFGNDSTMESDIHFTLDNAKLTGDAKITITSTENSDEGTMTYNIKYDLDACPDGDGRVKANFDINMGMGGGKIGNANTAAQGTAKGSMTGYVNDNAELTKYDFDVTSSLALQASKGKVTKGEFSESKISFTAHNMEQGKSNLQISDFSSMETRKSSAAKWATREEAGRIGLEYAHIFMILALHIAEKQWQNGYCVEIQVEGAEESNQLRPGDSDAFTAKVHHKFESADITAPITPTLSGEKSIDPSKKKDSPVDYTYQSPPEKDKEATITLETRSKRGADKTTISYKTVKDSYTVSGSIDEFSFTGVICDPNQPFTIEGAGGGGSATFSFTPGNSLSGTYTYKGRAGPIALSGNGPYEIKPGANGYGTLMLGGQGCVNATNCTSGTDPLDLSPLQDSSSCK
jgi:hypothetical protein